MILYIVRHAIAEDHNSKISDDDRELTREGVEKMKKVAAGLRAADAIPDVVLTSPLVRARHTAEILMSAFHNKPELKKTDSLAPTGKRSELYSDLKKLKKAGSVMIVGHQPSLGEIAGEIINGSPDLPLDFKKGGACAIQIDKFEPKPQGSLLWLTTPGILRKLS